MLKRIIKRIKKKKKSKNDVYDQGETCIDSNPAASEVHFVYKGINKNVPKNVTHLRFHPKITQIEDYNFEEYGPSNDAFMYCTSLREVVLNDGLREIGVCAFQGCVSLQKITIPSTVTKIGADAFNDCVSLREVVLNEGLQKIGWQAFFNCRSLENITLPSTVTSVGHCWTFTMCLKLKEVVLNEGLEEICPHTFNSCSSLERITIPSTVTKIGDGAFLGCDNLREVVLHESIKNMDKWTFGCRSSLVRFSFPSLSTRLDDIIQAGQRDIETNMDDIPAVEWRDGKLSIPPVRRQKENLFGRMETEVEVDREKLDKVKRLISYHEMKEATTLLELAMWKAKIDQEDEADDKVNKYSYNYITNREACRVEVPGPIKDTILQYLEASTTSTNSSVDVDDSYHTAASEEYEADMSLTDIAHAVFGRFAS